MDINQVLEENSKKLEEMPETPAPLVPEEERPVRNIPVPPSETRSLTLLPPDPYREAKREFLVTPDATIFDMAKKYRLNFNSLNDIAKAENWTSQRTNYLDRKMNEILVTKKEEANTYHDRIGVFMLQMALSSLRKRKSVPLNFREAKDFIVEAVKIRRQALGMEQGGPKIVNIINQQQAIFEKYKKK